MSENRQMWSVEDDSRTASKFRYDTLEVEMPFVSHVVRFSPMVTRIGICRIERFHGQIADTVGQNSNPLSSHGAY
jgi:hypothetical protein